MNQKSREKLIKKLERYYAKNAKNSVYFYPLAVLYYNAGEKEKAYQILEEGLKLFPRYILVLIKISQILIGDAKYNAALSYLETALNIQKSNTWYKQYEIRFKKEDCKNEPSHLVTASSLGVVDFNFEN